MQNLSREVPVEQSRGSTLIGVVVPIAVAVAGLLSMLGIGYSLRHGIIPTWPVFDHPLVNFSFTMQMLVFAVSLLVVAFMYFYDKERFKLFFRWGSMTHGDWAFYGTTVAVAFTLGAFMMMSLNVVSQNGMINGTFFRLLPLVFLFAATNAWSEEIFSRFVVVAGLHSKINPVAICWISAAIFGAAHINGTPSGPFGMLITGFLGWLLAKSVVDTKSLGWALTIHCLGDVVIFGAGAMILAGQH